MNVASLELCKELYELSGWETPDFANGFGTTYGCPRYDLGYLLRQLPRYINNSYPLSIEVMNDEWVAAYERWRSYDLPESVHAGWADTPEDAVTKLTIELFKQNILTKET